MSHAALVTLLERYADGRKLCNCRRAYYATGGKYWMGGKEYHDGDYCQYGCQANQHDAYIEMAIRVVGEFKL